MSSLHIPRPLASALALLFVGFGALGCSSPPPAPPPPPSGSAAATVDAGGSVEVSVEVGECLRLGGTDANPVATPVPCGSSESTHKVIGKAPKGEQCPADVNAVYSEHLFGVAEAGALCLDIDWVKGECYNLVQVDFVRTPCASAGAESVRVGDTLQGTADQSACPGGGAVYATRKFVVCFEAGT